MVVLYLFKIEVCMEQEKFYEVESLENFGESLSEGTQKKRDFLLMLVRHLWQTDIASRFSEFDDKDIDKIMATSAVLKVLYLEMAKLRGRASSLNSNFSLSNSSIRKYGRHARQIAGLAHCSGVLDVDSTSSIGVHDVCSSNGRLAHSLRVLRGDAVTRTISWELRPELRVGFEDWLDYFTPGSDTASFVNGDVENADLRRIDGLETYCLGKHACGSAVESILRSVGRLPVDQMPKITVIMTCCHGLAKSCYPFQDENVDINFEEWSTLLGMCATSRSYKTPEDVIGRVSMRLADVLRSMAVPEGLHSRVVEVLPPHLSAKNHGVILENPLSN